MGSRGLSAPSLRDVYFDFAGATWLPIVHLPWFISEIEEHHHAVHATFKGQGQAFHLSLLTQLEDINLTRNGMGAGFIWFYFIPQSQ